MLLLMLLMLLLLLMMLILLFLLLMTQLRTQPLVRFFLVVQSLQLLLGSEIGLTHGLELGVVPSFDFQVFSTFFAVIA